MSRAVLLLALMLFTISPASSDAPKSDAANRPEGNWYMGSDHPKSVPDCEIRIREGRMTWSIRLQSGSSIQLQADYSLTKDSALYAYITKVTCEEPSDKSLKDKLPGEEDTFSFRFRI